MSQQMREMWDQFNELEGAAQSPDTKALIAAIRLQTELLNIKLTAMEMSLAAIARAA